MKQLGGFAVILILLLAAAAWWWSSSTTAPTVPSVVPSAGPTVEPPRSDVAAKEPVQAAAREPVPVPETGGVLVRVVDAVTKNPVPAAAVSWLGKGLGKPAELPDEYAARALDAESFHRERGLHGVTDARGELRVAADGWLAVAARAGDRYGEAWTSRRAAELVVEVHADSALAIRTVDAAGRPVAGVAVRLACTWRDAGKEQTWRPLLPVSDQDGRTALPHVQELLAPRIAERLPQFRFSNAVEWQSATLGACASFGEGPPVAIDLRNLPPQPVDVVVPAIGSLEFVLHGPDGAPFPLQPGPHLRAVLMPKGGMSQPVEPGIHSQLWGADGRAVFPHVACGERLELLGRTNWYEGMKFDGPTRPGEHLVIDVNMSVDSVWITGRLLAEDGSPWTRETTLRLGGGHQLPGDAAGRFCVPVPEHARDKPRGFVDGDGGAVQAEIVLPTPLAAGMNDIGVVVLKRPPLLVSGQVVVRDAEGGPALQKTLRAHIESWNPEAMFGRADHMAVDLDAEGRFTVHALPRNKDYAFFVDGNIAKGGYRKFTPGTTGLVLEVSPGGSIVASFLVDPAWGYLTVSFTRVDAPDGSAVSSSMVPCASGRAVADADSLTAGAYRVTAAKGPILLAELRVTVPAGKAADDPQLRDYDLRNRGQTVHVTATDDRGAAIVGEVQIAWRPAGTGDDMWSVQRYTHDAGRGTTILSGGAIDVCVWAAGHRAVDQSAVLESAAIVLQPLPQVNLRWVDAPELPPGATVRLVWERVENGPVQAADQDGRARAAAIVREARRGGPLPPSFTDGTAKCCAVSGERLRVRLQLAAHLRNSAPFAVAPAELDAATFVDGQMIELRADPAAVQAALQQLARK